MMSKNQFCRCIISDYIKRNNLASDVKYEDLARQAYAYSNTSLGIALEHLGAPMSDDIKTYLSSRGGVQFINIEKDGTTAILSTREIIDMLPDIPD